MAAMATPMKGVLSNDFISELMGKGRTRNAYAPKLETFVESDEPGINVRETWPVEFGKKNASTLYQGFNLAINKAEIGTVVMVKRDGDDVYLLNRNRIPSLANEE